MLISPLRLSHKPGPPQLAQIITIVFAIINAVPSIAAEWVPIVEDHQFDKSRIKIDKNSGNLKVWLKFKYFELNELQKKSNYAYTINLVGMNCKEETFGTIKGIDYDDVGRVIFSWDPEQPKFSPVAPGTISEAIVKAVCNFVAKEKKKKK